MSFNREWEAEKDRLSRIETQMAVMPPQQRTRLEEAQRQGELALARTFGNRLDARVSERIVAGMILEPTVLCTIGGGVNELPTDQAGWDRWAKDAANKEPLARLSLDHSDAHLREQLSREVLASIPPARRMDLARNGTLDAHVDGQVKARLEARNGV